MAGAARHCKYRPAHGESATIAAASAAGTTLVDYERNVGMQAAVTHLHRILAEHGPDGRLKVNSYVDQLTQAMGHQAGTFRIVDAANADRVNGI